MQKVQGILEATYAYLYEVNKLCDWFTEKSDQCTFVACSTRLGEDDLYVFHIYCHT